MSKDSGVSEVIGTLLLLGITVALFFVAFAWASTFRPPERAPYAELSAYLNDGGDGWGNGNERILIAHRGGEPLLQDNTEVMITIDESPIRYGGKDLKFSDGFFYLGEVWRSTGERIGLDSTVYVSVVCYMESGALAILPEQRLIPTERAAGLPDLALYEDDVQYNPPLMEGQTIVIRASVNNLGRSDAGSFYVALFEGKETEGKMINRTEVKSLQADDAKMVSLLYPSIPFDPAKETKEVTIVVDYMNAVPEGNEKNNIVHLTLKPGGKATMALVENFEYGAEGWTHDGDQDEWEIGGPTAWNGPQWFTYPDTAHWGSKCWGTDLDNTYNNNGDCWLVSPEVDLTKAKSANLTFWHWHYFETDWDFGYLEITTDGGSTWQTVATYTGAKTQWSQQLVDLNAYAGNVVQLKFHLKTDDYGTAAGWYLDDLSLVGSREV